MMNDMFLDGLLTKWRSERTPRPGDFPSHASFERRFFTAVRIEKQKRPRKTPRPSGLVNLIGKIRPAFQLPEGVCASYSLAPGALFAARTASRIHCCCSPARGLFDDAPIPGSAPVFDTEEYKTVGERPFVAVTTNPLSTFGADVDTAMYADLRRMVLKEDRLPPPEAVRLAELINYFSYDYPQPEGDSVMRPHCASGAAPWAPERRLLLIGVQTPVPDREKLPPSHYVFLIDNSGSMEDVFPMVREAMTALARNLRSGDRVSMVTYGGGVRVLLEGCSDVSQVCEAIAKLEAEGYTPGGEGIQTAYALAEKHFIKGGNNRIVLVTDGDFNVGASSEADLVDMVKAKRDTGIYLTVAGCGMGNYKDNKLKMLANKGNGNAFYLDSMREAKRVFVHGMTGNMYALARDVKFQVEFNPARVFAYRLLGYELRDMTDRDFRDDKKESGAVGQGQQLTALYEIIPADAAEAVKNAAVPEMPPLKYQSASASNGSELLTFRIRWREPQGKKAAREDAFSVPALPPEDENWNWAAAVAEAGLALRHSDFAPDTSLEHAAKQAQQHLGEDPSGDRAEFLLLLRRAAELSR